jgi:tetratricopeptide (TPR) repeat protein
MISEEAPARDRAAPGAAAPDRAAPPCAAPRRRAPRACRALVLALVGVGAAGSVLARADEPPRRAEVAAEPLDPAMARRERDVAYAAFRADFDAGRYNDALPHAERVVALSEALDAAGADLARALNNLGATQYRLGDFIAAEAAYGRALQLVEEQQGSSSRRLLVPLQGLALTYQAAGRHDAAAPLLERAVAISRHADGLFNPQQHELLRPLVDSLVALGRWQDADREQLYDFRLSERQYGANDPRVLPALERLANWYSATGRNAQARATWQRVLTISTDRRNQNLGGALVALRGIAETFRLDYQNGAEPAEENAQRAGQIGFHSDMGERDPFGRRVAPAGAEYHLESQGKDMLEAALKLAERAQPPAPRAVAAVLIDLGDWQLIAERPDRARPYLERAWSLLPDTASAAEGVAHPLGYPVQLLYRAPPAARRFRDQPIALVTEATAIAEFTVTADGRVRDVQIVEGDASDYQAASLKAALGKAIYRPRLVDGQPVATEKVRFRETFRQMKH